MMRLVLVIFFLEAGFVLAIAPWSAYWDRNFFVETYPLLRAFITNNFVRGAVTGLGVVNVIAAVADLITLFTRRAAPPANLSVVESPVADEP